MILAVPVEDDVVDGGADESGVSGLKGKGFEEWSHLFTDFPLQYGAASCQGVFADTVFFVLDLLLDADIDHAFLVDVVENKSEDDE